MDVSLPVEFTLSPHMADAAGTDASDAGFIRLDVCLGHIFPDLGVRGRRRLWTWCTVLVNGTARPAGFMVSPGDTITVRQTSAAPQAKVRQPGGYPCSEIPGIGSIRILAVSSAYIAFFKPEWLHSVHLPGGQGASFERLLVEYWPSLAADQGLCETEAPPELLTRLDFGTSGILLAARSPEGKAAFRQWEKTGLVTKEYFALVRGTMTEPATLRWRLNTDGTARTRVLDDEDCDSTRHTSVIPLRQYMFSLDRWGYGGPAVAVTLVQATIHRGARHQIRAHLAHAGFPLLGEELYADTLRIPAQALQACHDDVAQCSSRADAPPVTDMPPVSVISPSAGALAADTAAHGMVKGTASALEHNTLPLFLHHARVRFPGLHAEALPDWLQDGDERRSA